MRVENVNPILTVYLSRRLGQKNLKDMKRKFYLKIIYSYEENDLQHS